MGGNAYHGGRWDRVIWRSVDRVIGQVRDVEGQKPENQEPNHKGHKGTRREGGKHLLGDVGSGDGYSLTPKANPQSGNHKGHRRAGSGDREIGGRVIEWLGVNRLSPLELGMKGVG